MEGLHLSARPALPHAGTLQSSQTAPHLLVLPLAHWEKGSEAPAARPLGAEVERRRGSERAEEGAVKFPTNP